MDSIDNIKIDCSSVYDYKPDFFEMISRGNTSLYKNMDNTDNIDIIIEKEIKRIRSSIDNIDKNALIEIIDQDDILLHIIIKDYENHDI